MATTSLPPRITSLGMDLIGTEGLRRIFAEWGGAALTLGMDLIGTEGLRQ